MDKNSLKQYLGSSYQGPESFLMEIIFPIFGEEDFEDGYETELLDTEPERRQLATATGIRSVKQLGNFYVGVEPLYLFDITVADHVLMRRNRVGIQRLIRSVMDQYSCAFMVFHYDDVAQWNWRFSFCQKKKSEKDTTDSKRYTFLLGPGQSCRTARDNFWDLYERRGQLSVDDIQNAFSVEALSNEFFDKYKKHYEDILLYVTGKRYVKKNNKWVEEKMGEPCMEIMRQLAWSDDPEKAVRDYVKKLMGRIVFLLFLQKKGWLGVPIGEPWGNGDGEFIQHLFAECSDKDNFVDDVLEILFDDLNTEREGDISKLSTLHSQPFKVPYLNGGLFERDAADDAAFPLPAHYMQSLLDFFSEYNFTIDENDPNDAEVGVDPEMLGRIFENLLEDNKDKGAYYTPKEIVQYMCRESLIGYLQTKIDDEPTCSMIRQFVTTHDASVLGPWREFIDDRLCNVKICDPAIGSGAFPMGLLKELFLCRMAIEGIEPHQAALIKKQIIQQNIYGVDIERGAVDIARLRFWLSLVVDEETPHALPNLDFKIMQGNSLLEWYKGVDLSEVLLSGSREGKLLFVNEGNVTKTILQEYIRRYYTTLDKNEKRLLDKKIDQAVRNIIVDNNTSLRNLVSEMNVRNNQDFFLWHIFFAEVFDNGGFDIVIGNPPYISAPTQIASSILAEQRERIKDCGKYNTLNEKWDLYVPFMERGIKLLSPHGVFSMIVPYPLSNQKYAKKLRSYICEKKHLTEVVDANGVKVFENATVSNCIVFVNNATSAEKTRISHIDKAMNIQVDFHKTASELVQDQGTYVWNLTQEERSGNRFGNMRVLGDYCYISKGMVLNADEKNAKGAFKKEDLISLSKDSIHSRAYIEAKDIDKYVVKRIRFLEWETERCPDQLSRPTFKELYDCPKLMVNRLGIMKVYLDKGVHFLTSDSMFCTVLWKDLHHVKNKSITSSIKKFCNGQHRYDLEKYSKEVSLYYLLGILNSNMADVLLADQRGGDYHIYPEHIRKIPIPPATPEQQQPIIRLANEILSAKQAHPDADTTAQEQEIDRLVYHLYGLTYDEVLIIDPTPPFTREEYEQNN